MWLEYLKVVSRLPVQSGEVVRAFLNRLIGQSHGCAARKILLTGNISTIRFEVNDERAVCKAV